jgi:hypothetical protein
MVLSIAATCGDLELALLLSDTLDIYLIFCLSDKQKIIQL